MPRLANKTDIDEIKKLWKICFGDTDSFIDWNFKNNYSEENAIVAEIDGKVASAMQIVAHSLTVLEKPLSVAYIWGMSTDPNFQGRGLARSIFDLSLPLLYSRGYDTSVLMSAVNGMYEKFGYVRVCDFKIYTCPDKFGQSIKFLESGLTDKLDTIYKKNVKSKAIYGERDCKYWDRVVDDVFNGSKGYIMLSDDAYALLYPHGDGYLAGEIIGVEKKPEAQETMPVMIRVINAYETAKKLSPHIDCKAKISIKDPWIKENNITLCFVDNSVAICDGEGEKMDIAEFTKWLVLQGGLAENSYIAYPL